VIVVDASAAVAALTSVPPHQSVIDRLADDSDLHAPHLIDVEYLHVLRRFVWTGRLSPETAVDARTGLLALGITRYSHELLLERMWALRHNLTAYDAAYVALSELLEAPLVTTDARVAAVPGHHATVEVYGPDPEP
jgi:predicted nucleic acid-binding protein